MNIFHIKKIVVPFYMTIFQIKKKVMPFFITSN